MANVDAPHGFSHVSLDGPFPPLIRSGYKKLVGVGTAIFQNDVVHAVGGMNIEPFGTGTPGTTKPLGVAQNYGAASTATSRHSVIIANETTTFEAQDDDDSNGIVEADMNKNANVSAGAGSTTTFFSGHEIDEASVAVTGTLDLKLLRLFPYPNNAFGEHARILVKFNTGRELTLVAGV